MTTLPIQTLYYINEYTDEVVPCDCTLEGWAKWLSAADYEWNREEPAKDGELFKASTIQVLGDVRVEFIDGKWIAVETIPDGTEMFWRRHFKGGAGWDAEFAADTIADATDCIYDDEGPLWFACTKDGPKVVLTYRADGPRFEVEPAQ